MLPYLINGIGGDNEFDSVTFAVVSEVTNFRCRERSAHGRTCDNQLPWEPPIDKFELMLLF